MVVSVFKIKMFLIFTILVGLQICFPVRHDCQAASLRRV